MEAWQKPETVTLWIVIAVFFIVVLLASMVLLVRSVFKRTVKNKMKEANTKLEHQQELLRANISIQENERKRIAADLHDTLIGRLAVMHMRSQIANNDPELMDSLKESIEIARRISHDLSPPLLEYTTLPDMIEEIVESWKKVVNVSYISDVRSDCSHSDDMKIQLTRIIQEVMNNISKHADATQIQVYFRQTPNWLALQVKDNGKGFNQDNKKKGIGLKNIETRMQYLKGHYHLKSALNKGTSALFLLKISKSEPA